MTAFATPSYLPGQTWTTSSEPGRSAMSLYSSAQSSRDAFADGVQRTQQPIMTGTSVLGIKYDKGVLLAADTLASYGSLARFDDVSRLHRAGKTTCVAASGDISDFQHLQHMIDAKIREEALSGDEHSLSSSQLYEWLSRVMYGRRNKMDPLWNSLLIGGWEDDQPFLGYLDLLGTTYTSPTIATGYGSMIAQPLLRKATEGREGKISRQEAEEVLLQSLRVLFYRDARSINKFQIADITANGVDISKPRSVDTEWAFAEKLRGYGPQTQ